MGGGGIPSQIATQAAPQSGPPAHVYRPQYVNYAQPGSFGMGGAGGWGGGWGGGMGYSPWGSGGGQIAAMMEANRMAASQFPTMQPNTFQYPTRPTNAPSGGFFGGSGAGSGSGGQAYVPTTPTAPTTTQILPWRNFQHWAEGGIASLNDK